jgi:eukaryotic-like serine/threonine-protein kinase
MRFYSAESEINNIYCMRTVLKITMQVWTRNTQLQNGQYIIQKVIGGGGFGETYRAEDTEEKRLVVIKTLNREQQQKPDFIERQRKFRKEALDLAKCYHPHIVQVYDTFLEDGLQAIIMEHIDGDNLELYVENYFNENGFLPEVEALRYIDQIGQALECVHERRLLHRDVKPSNIILRQKTKEAVLIDFGLAREFQLGKIRTMTASKTEGYAPIEQYERRGDFGYYTDVYALAATLYTLLTVRVPIPSHYRAEDDVTLSPPQKYNQNISKRTNDAILKGMELEPINRPQTIREFREMLGLVVPAFVNTPPLKYTHRTSQEGTNKNTLIPQVITPEIQLKSSVGIDYKKLYNLLITKKWQEADEETARVMLAIAKREKEGYLDTRSINNFPCEDLCTIDNLWVKCSDGRFGFSVQKKIYQSLGGTKKYDDNIWQSFGETVGWRKEGKWLYYKNITFDKTATKEHRKGHLPVAFGYEGGWFLLGLGGLGGGQGWVEVFCRLHTCMSK